ncbi:TPA: hypothetical protein RTG16_001890, partial [Campylobacter jejuni]|nr:hypothetical protein [Campylobacter jejuni]
MKKPFYKLKRFYIPCVALAALIIFVSLAYHFLQRPLELIFWDRYDILKLSINNEEKNFKTMKTIKIPLKDYISNIREDKTIYLGLQSDMSIKGLDEEFLKKEYNL